MFNACLLPGKPSVHLQKFDCEDCKLMIYKMISIGFHLKIHHVGAVWPLV